MKNLRRWAGAAALVALTGAAAEVTARLDDWIRWDMSPLAAPDEAADLRWADSSGVRGRPNGRYQRFRLNNHGFRRVEDVARTPAAGCTRVMTLGASETLGTYEPAGQEYPAQLERVLRATGGCYEVLNAGVAGMSLRHIIHTWRHHWRTFQPHVVVVYPSPVVYVSSGAPTWPDPQELQRDAGRPWPAVSLRPRLLHRAKEAIVVPAPLQRRRVARRLAALVAALPSDSIWREVPRERLAMFGADLDSLLVEIRAAGAEPVLATHARRFPLEPGAEDAELLDAWRSYYPRAEPRVLIAFDAQAAQVTRDVARARGVRIADVDCLLSGKRERFGDFVHFTGEGAGIAAGAIAQAITARDTAATPAAAFAAGAPPTCRPVQQVLSANAGAGLRE